MSGFVVAAALGLALAVVAGVVGVAAATVSQLELTRWVRYRLRGADAAVQLRDNPGRLVATANALATLGLVLAAGALPAAATVEGPLIVGLGVVLVAITVFLACAYLIPRVVGRRWAEPLARRAVPWMDRIGRVLAPLLPHRDTSPRMALAAVLSGTDTHALSTTGELAVVSGVLAFTDRPVREIMTPRTATVALPEGMLTAEAAHVFSQAGFSRYPVYRESLDEIVGVMRAFELLRHPPDAPIPVHPALLVPATTRSGDVLREMQRGQGHLAVVLDEFGGTAGLVTFDDLLRSLVEDVFDEAAAEAESSPVVPEVVELDGSVEATVLAERFGITLGSRETRTVGGLLAQLLGRIPHVGERLVLAGLEFDILQASATRVERIAVRRGPVRPIMLDAAGGGQA